MPRAPFWNDRRLTRYPLAIAAAMAAASTVWWLAHDGNLDPAGKPLGADFLGFYAASELILEGRAADLYGGGARYHAVQERIAGVPLSPLPWHYPPVAVLFVAPLALLPYVPAFFISMGVLAGAFVAAIRGIDRRPFVTALALGFPGLWQSVLQGQNGCLTAAILAAGLGLAPRRPIAAGIILGVLAYKPQYLPLVGAALVAAGAWRAVAGLAGSAAGLAAASLPVAGMSAWEGFLHELPLATDRLFSFALPVSKMPTVAAAAAMAGLPRGAALALQSLAAAGALAAVAWAFSRRAAPWEARLAVLFPALFLFTPFAFDYDLAVLGPGLLWLGRTLEARDAFGPVSQSLLVAGYLLPVLGPMAGAAGLPLAPVVLALLLALSLRQLAHGPHPAGTST